MINDIDKRERKRSTSNDKGGHEFEQEQREIYGSLNRRN